MTVLMLLFVLLLLALGGPGLGAAWRLVPLRRGADQPVRRQAGRGVPPGAPGPGDGPRLDL